MAKFKVEVDLDWIDGESSIDEQIKNQMISEIKKTVVDKMLKIIQDKTETKVNEQIDDMVVTAVSQRIEKFLSEPRNITDKYGDIVKKNVTVDSLLKDKIDGALTQKVLDQNGKYTGLNGYGAKYTIFEYLSTKNLEEMVGNAVEKATKNTKKEIEEMVASALKGRIAENLTDMILQNSSVLGLKTNKDVETKKNLPF